MSVYYFALADTFTDFEKDSNLEILREYLSHNARHCFAIALFLFIPVDLT